MNMCSLSGGVKFDKLIKESARKTTCARDMPAAE